MLLKVPRAYYASAWFFVNCKQVKCDESAIYMVQQVRYVTFRSNSYRSYVAILRFFD